MAPLGMAYPGFDAQDPSFYDGFGGQMPFSAVPHEHHAVEESSKDKPHLAAPTQQSQSHTQNQPPAVQSQGDWENERSAQGAPAPLGLGIGMGMSGMGMGMPGPYAPAMSLGPQFGAGMYGYPPYGYPAPGQFGGFPAPPAQAPRQQHGPQPHHAGQHGGHHQHHGGHLAQQAMPMNFPPPQFMPQFSKFQGPVGFEDDAALGYGFSAEPSQHPQPAPSAQHQGHGNSHLGGISKQQTGQSGDHGKSFAISQQTPPQPDYPPYMQQGPGFPFGFAGGFGQPNMAMNPPNARQ